jgi:hypothetical protein
VATKRYYDDHVDVKSRDEYDAEGVFGDAIAW